MIKVNQKQVEEMVNTLKEFITDNLGDTLQFCNEAESIKDINSYPAEDGLKLALLHLEDINSIVDSFEKNGTVDKEIFDTLKAVK